MPIRRLVLDVDKAITEPDMLSLAAAIESAAGVRAANVTVTEIDVETVGMDITVEGEAIDADSVVRAIEHTGAVVHSIDEVVVGTHLLERTPRQR